MHASRLAGLVAGLLLPLSAAHAATGQSATARGMARIPAGSYRPLYAQAGVPRIRVAAFSLDRLPVMRAEYLEFVIANPQWQRGSIRPLFADAAYLSAWPAPTSAGGTEDLRRPVTEVSWFAARAFCAARGGRLPTLDEWEYVAAASSTRRDAGADPMARRTLLARYMARPAGLPARVDGAQNLYGVRAMHGVVWEWTMDFNSVVVGDDSRASGGGQDAREHHLFCASAAIGATDPADYPAFQRFATRASLTARSTTSGVGFRCAA